MFSECFKPLKEYTATWLTSLLPIFIANANDQCDDVRNNAVYGIGELVINSDEASYEHYPKILAILSEAVAKETHAGTLDNICGALGRLIITNSSLVPLKQVLPVFIQYLPLREDYAENFAVFRSLHVVYTQGREELLSHIERIIELGLLVLFEKKYTTDECRCFVFNFVRQIHQDFTEQFNKVVQTLSQQNESNEFVEFILSLKQ